MTAEPLLIDTGPSPYGWSRIGAFLKCPRLFAYRYVLNLEKAGHKPALVKGSLIHVGLAHHYARMGARQGGVVLSDDVATGYGDRIANVGVLVTDPDVLLEPGPAMEEWCRRHPEGEIYLPQARLCVSRYQGHYLADDFRVNAVERVLWLSLGKLEGPDCTGLEAHRRYGKELWFTQRADLEIGKPGQGFFIVDHKTSGRVTKAHQLMYSRHGQFFGFRLHGKRIYGDQFAGTWPNMVQTDGMKFERPPLEMAPHAVRTFLARLRRAEIQIARLELELDGWEWPAADNELVCYHRYGKCDGWELCQMGSGLFERR